MQACKKIGACKMTKPTGKAKGGKARAEKLTKEERSVIARKGGNARWREPGSGISKASYAGDLVIGDMVLPCSVIEDANGKAVRVISTRGISTVFTGNRGGGSGARKTPRFLNVKALNSFIPNGLMARIVDPIEYHPLHGGRTAFGYEATLLPEVCEVILDATRAGALKDEGQAIVAEMLLRGFARVGIIALVDEATGYQEKRARDALSKFLEMYLVEEKLRWARIFPDEFYKELYRLRGWAWPSGIRGKPSYVGILTNEVVYERLPKGVLEELKTRNPVIPEKKRRAFTYTQFLSEDIGQKDLKSHLFRVITLMQASTSWSGLITLLDRVAPKGKEIPLSLFNE